MSAAAWVFLAAAVVFALIALVVLLGADDKHKRDMRRLERMAAKNLELRAELTDLNDCATCLEAMVGPVDEQPARHLKAVPTVANVIDLIAHNEATRDLPNIDTWLNGWETNGDPA